MNKPKPEDYVAFYAGYIALVCEGPILDILEDQGANSHYFFSKLTEEQANYAYAEGKWTIKEVLGHMIDAERTFAYRVLAFSRGQEELPGFDENRYVERSTFNERAITDLADEFNAVRKANLYLLRSLSHAQQLATGIANGSPIAVGTIVYIMAGHELHHLNIIKERYLKER